MQSEDSAHSTMSASHLLSFPPCFPSSSIVKMRSQGFPERSCIALLQHSATLERQAYGSEVEAKEGRVVVSISPWPGPGENPAGNESIIITTFITANKWLSPMALYISQTSQNQMRFHQQVRHWGAEKSRTHPHSHFRKSWLSHTSDSITRTASSNPFPDISLIPLRSELGPDSP